MSLVVAYQDSTGVWIGGESKASSSDEAFFTANPKVFSKGLFTYGFVGSYRFGQLLQYGFKAPTHSLRMDDDTYMITVWSEAFQKWLNEHGLVRNKDGVTEIGDDGSCIIIYRGSIYMLQEDFAVLRSSDPYAAIGSGASYALGAMWALHKFDIPGEQIVGTALDAGSIYSPQCGGSKTIIKHTSAKAKKHRARGIKK